MKVSDIIDVYCSKNEVLTLYEVVSFLIESLKNDDERKQRDARIEYIVLGRDELEGYDNQINQLRNEFGNCEEEILEYLKSRIAYSKHPVLLARYNDILWEYRKTVSNKYPQIEFAIGAIDNYICVITKKIEKTDIYNAYKLIRAFNLSIQISNKEKIQATKRLLIESTNYHLDEKPGIWSNIFKCFLQNRRLFNEEEVKIFEHNMVDRLHRFESTINFYHSEHAVLCLLEFYSKLKDKDRLLETLQIYQRIYVKISSNLSGLQKSYWLNEIRALFIKYQFIIEANEISKLIQDNSEDIKKDLNHSYDIKVELNKADLDKQLESIEEKSTDYQMAFIVYNFIRSKKHFSESPFEIVATKMLLNPDYMMTAQVGMEDDGLLIQQSVDMLNMNAPILHYVIGYLINKGKLSQNQVIEVLKKSPVLKETRYKLLETALESFYLEKNEVFIHMIIPQIEAAFRELLLQMGGVVIRSNKLGGDSYKLLDELLREPLLKEVFTDDVLFNLRVILVENRGWNIRNNVCHGILSDEHFNIIISERLLQVTFLLGLIRFEEV